MKNDKTYLYLTVSVVIMAAIWTLGLIFDSFFPGYHALSSALIIIGLCLFIMRSRLVLGRLKTSQLASAQKYQKLFDLAPVGIGVADRAGHILESNRTMADLVGHKPSDFKLVNLADTYVNPNDRQRLMAELNKTGRISNWEVKLKRGDGTVYTAMLNAELVEIEGEQRLLTIARDVSDLEKMVETKTTELQAANERLRQEIAQHRRDEEDLKEKIHELQIFSDAAVGRELKMAELENKLEELKKQCPKT